MITNCQRCDKDLRIPDGENSERTPQSHDNKLEGKFSFHGAYGSLKYDYQMWEAELCETCCAELRGWINAGPGKGVMEMDEMEISKEAADSLNMQAIPGPGVEGHDQFREAVEKVIAKKYNAFLEREEKDNE